MNRKQMSTPVYNDQSIEQQKFEFQRWVYATGRGKIAIVKCYAQMAIGDTVEVGEVSYRVRDIDEFRSPEPNLNVFPRTVGLLVIEIDAFGESILVAASTEGKVASDESA
jgi:hypothetical protein